MPRKSTSGFLVTEMFRLEGVIAEQVKLIRSLKSALKVAEFDKRQLEFHAYREKFKTRDPARRPGRPPIRRRKVDDKAEAS